MNRLALSDLAMYIMNHVHVHVLTDGLRCGECPLQVKGRCVREHKTLLVTTYLLRKLLSALHLKKVVKRFVVPRTSMLPTCGTRSHPCWTSVRGNTASDIYTRSYIHILMAEMDVSTGMKAVFHPMKSGSRLVVTRVEAPSIEMSFQIVNTNAPNSPSNMCVFSIFEASDSVTNLKVVGDRFGEEIGSLQ